MTKAEKARKLINDNWSESMKEAVTKKFGKIDFVTEYNFFSERHVSKWKKQGKVKDTEIKLFAEGFESGMLGAHKLVTAL